MSFKSDVLKVASGTAISQVITLVVAPLLARLFAPEAFGSAALFASLLGISGVFACLCYEQAIVLSLDDRDAANLLALCVGLAGASAFVIGVVLWLGQPLLAPWARASRLSAYLWLLPVATFMQGTFSALNFWNTRTRQFGRLSASQIAGQATSSSLNVAGGVAGYASAGTMIYSSIAGQGVLVATLGGRVLRDQHSLLRRSVRFGQMLAQLKRHRNFPLYTSWSALVNAASWQLPVLMLGGLFAPAIAGFYALGFRVLQLPMSLIGRSISQVFLQRAATAHADGSLALLVKTLFQKLLVSCALPCLILAIVGKDVFVLVFGAKWSEAGVYVQMLAPWALIWFLSSPLSSLYYVLGRQREEMLIQATIFLSRLVALGIGGYLGDARLAVLLFACSGILAYGYLVKVLFGFVQLKTWAVVWECVVPLRDALLLAAPVLAVKLLDAPTVVLLGVAAGAVAVFGLRHQSLLRGP